MSGRGAGDRPLTYAGLYDAAVTYLPRQMAVGSDGVAYMAIALTAGNAPPNPTYWLALGGGGGAALLGYAEVDFTFGTPVAADGSVNYATASSVSTSGSAGVTVDGAGRWSYCTDGIHSVYAVAVALSINPHGTHPIASDVMSFDADFAIAAGNGCFVGDSWDVASFPGITALISPHGPYFPQFRATATDTSLMCTAEATLTLLRFAQPVDPPPPPSEYRATVMADLPALYWRLGDASGTTAADSSGNGRDGTYGGSPTLAQSGLLVGDSDDCVLFNGGTDHAEIAYASWLDTADLTLECLFETTASGYRSFIDRDNDGPREFQFRLNNGVLEFLIIGGSVVTASGATALNDGLPHHVAVTYDGAVINLYADGVLDGTLATAVPLPQSATPFRAGYNYSGPGPAQSFVGKIDEVAYYKNALSAGRIAAHFAATGL